MKRATERNEGAVEKFRRGYLALLHLLVTSNNLLSSTLTTSSPQMPTPLHCAILHRLLADVADTEDGLNKVEAKMRDVLGVAWIQRTGIR